MYWPKYDHYHRDLMSTVEKDGLCVFGYKGKMYSETKLPERIYLNGTCFSVVTKGSEHYKIGGKYYEVRAGEALVVVSGENYESFFPHQTASTCVYWRLATDVKEVLGLNQTLSKQLIDDLLKFDKCVVPISKDGINNCKAAADIMRNGNADLSEKQRLQFYNLLTSVILEILSSNEKKISDYDKRLIDEVTDWIENNLEQHIELDDLAKRFNISYNALNGKFREITTHSIGSYIHFRRILKAAQMLCDGHTVTHCAQTLDYCSSSYFSTVFAQFMHMRPTAYVNDIKKGAKNKPPEIEILQR